MKNYKRAERVAGEVHRALSEVLLRGLKDPRVGLISLTQVEVTDDLRLARVRFLPLGGKGDPKRILEGLRAANGYLNREVNRRLNLKYSPKLEFHLDEVTPLAISMVESLQRQSEAAMKEHEEE